MKAGVQSITIGIARPSPDPRKKAATVQSNRTSDSFCKTATSPTYSRGQRFGVIHELPKGGYIIHALGINTDLAPSRRISARSSANCCGAMQGDVERLLRRIAVGVPQAFPPREHVDVLSAATMIAFSSSSGLRARLERSTGTSPRAIRTRRGVTNFSGHGQCWTRGLGGEAGIAVLRFVRSRHAARRQGLGTKAQ